MSYTILYTPSGQPWQVPNSEISRFLAKGYRRENPTPTSSPEPKEESHASNTPDEHDKTDDRIRINHDSITKIAKLPGIGTATAKAVVANRPYNFLEDLIEAVPFSKEGQSWASLENQISFD